MNFHNKFKHFYVFAMLWFLSMVHMIKNCNIREDQDSEADLSVAMVLRVDVAVLRGGGHLRANLWFISLSLHKYIYIYIYRSVQRC